MEPQPQRIQGQQQQMEQMPINGELMQLQPLSYYFPPPPIPDNITYTKSMNDFQDSIELLTKTFCAFEQFRRIRNPHAGEPQQPTKKNKAILKQLSQQIMQAMIDNLKTLSLDKFQQLSFDPQLEKIREKTTQFMTLCRKLKIAEVRRSICNIMKNQTIKMKEKTQEINKAFNDIEQYLDNNIIVQRQIESNYEQGSSQIFNINLDDIQN